MSGRRWSLWLGPPVALVAVALVVSRFQPGAEAGGRVTPPPAGACAASPVTTDAAGVVKRDAGPASWWRLSERLDDHGVLKGRQLAVGRGGAIALTLDLAAESMASGPIGGLVVLAVDDGRKSEIRLVSAGAGCSWLVDTSPNVVRGAILDPSDGSVLAHLVNRATRADLGTWRFGARGALTEPALVAGAVPNGLLDGPVWATDLRLDQAGTSLAVQSCTDTGCVTRLFDLPVRGGDPRVLRGAQGPILGFAAGRLITWAACSGFPCAIQSWDLATGLATKILDRADAAAVTADGRYLVASIDARVGHTLRIELATNTRALVKGIGRDELLLAGGATATTGLQVGPDEIAVAAPGANPRSFRPAAAEVIP